jgi:hypothetical protein
MRGQRDVLSSDSMGAKVHDNKENLKMCRCQDCPTFKNSGLTVGLFCARGKATEEEEDILQAGCMCWDCVVFDNYNLDMEYYCVRGKSEEIPP